MNLMTRSPIVFTTRVLGGSTGVSQAGLDIALALSQRASVLRVRAWVPTHLPRELDGRAFGPCEWLPMSPWTVAQALRHGEAPPRALLTHTALFERGVRGRLSAGLLPLAAAPTAKLEIVNGLGAHRLFAAAWPARKARPSDLVSALVVHESPRHFDSAPRRMDLAQALQALRSYDYRVFVSERGQKEWEQLGNLDAARSTYIPNCVQEKRVLTVLSSSRTELRKRFGYGAGDVHALCVGRVSTRKGQDFVLASLRAMPPGAPPVCLDFLGDCRSDWARALIAGLRGSGLASQVRFLGNVNDVYERMYAADALLVGSRAEAFPLVVVEAMALGMCVVAPDIDGLREQIVDEETGLLFGAESVAEFAGCLSRVARDARLRERLGVAGRARYLERFTRDRQWARWNSALQWMGYEG